MRHGSIHQVIGSISTKTGVAPVNATLFAVAANVNDGTITSSPMPIPRLRRPRCRAEVPELTAMHNASATANLENSSSQMKFNEETK
jgi:hypothetical protein